MQYPHLTEDQLNQATRAYMMQIQSGFTGNTAAYDKSYYQQVSHKNTSMVKLNYAKNSVVNCFFNKRKKGRQVNSEGHDGILLVPTFLTTLKICME